MCDWLGGAGGCVLSGPWRLTEPCDVTIGGATWLDQAQETATRANQNAGPHRKKTGQQRAAPIRMGVGGWERQGQGQVPNKGGRRGDRQLQIHIEKERDQTTVQQQQKKKKKCPQRSREEEEMQGEA